jgi:adenylate kinase family enzyme
MVHGVNARTLVIGNSGSGKTTLSRRLAADTSCPVLALDDVYWLDMPGLKKRGAVDARTMTTTFAAQPGWVIEGVFGWLIDVTVPRATHLIWLDLPWSACRANLLARGPGPVSDAEFESLLIWAEAYWSRTSSSSHAAHADVFDRFKRDKIALTCRAKVTAFMNRDGSSHV